MRREARRKHHRILDQPENRVDGRDKVTGKTRFVADHIDDFPGSAGELQVAFVGSPHPHARILSVDITSARRAPGVHLILTGADVRPMRLGRQIQDWPLLAGDVVRFVGDRVAAVAADSLAQAQAAAAQIEVVFEELPAILDVEHALAPSAPVLHPAAHEYRRVSGNVPSVGHRNLQGERTHEHGSVVEGFAAARYVFEHRFETPRTFAGFLEPRAAVVWREGDRFHVLTTNKSPFRLREQMALSLGLRPDQLVIHARHIGGDFGAKGLSLDEHVLVLLARLTGRRVRSVTPYADDIAANNTRHAALICLRTGVDGEGRILAHEADVLFDGGAYAAANPGVHLMPSKALSTLEGYHVPNARIRARAVYTNTVPAGNARSPGQPQNAFAAESHVDLIARNLGIDPLELRLRNAIRPGEVSVTGAAWPDASMVRVLSALRERRDGVPASVRAPEVGPPSVARGRGFAAAARESASGSATVAVGVGADAVIEVLTGVPDQGGGAATAIQRMVCEELGVTVAQVRVRQGSTAEAPFDAGVGGSRVTSVVGGAAVTGARRLREQLEKARPGASLADLLSWAARTGGVQLVAEFELRSEAHTTAAYQIDVEVDRATGQVRVVSCLLVVDVGTLINPVAARGQLVGGFVTGFGQALMEELRLTAGVVMSPNLDGYKLPTARDVPPLRLVLLTDELGDGPFGAKSVGELTNSAVAPAIANAIEDAVGVRLRSLPLTAERLWNVLHAAAD